MDGLIFDTEALYQEACCRAADEIGHEMTPTLFRRMIGLPSPESRALLLEHYGASFAVDTFFEAWIGHFNASP
jgi:beta-phosphoglucomutase-like phosphatase (HAD superfamily)